MRRKRRNTGWCVSCRRGAIARVNIRKRRAHSPRRCSIYATGSAPSPPLPVKISARICQPSIAAGTSASRWTTHLAATTPREVRTPRVAGAISEPLPQVHARVQPGDLVCIAIEHARGDAFGEQLALRAGDAAFGLLRPARMVHARIDVTEEAVFRGLRIVPAGEWHGLDESDGDNRLDALEAIFPRHYQPQRRAVLLRQRLAVQAGDEEGEGMHGLVDAQALAVGPVQRTVSLTGHLLVVLERGEGDVLRLGVGFEATEHLRQRHAQPWNHHRPTLDAAQAIDAFFGRGALEQVVQRHDARLRALAAYRHAPWLQPQRAAGARRVALAGAEFVEVVVGGDVLVARELLAGTESGARLFRRDRHL